VGDDGQAEFQRHGKWRGRVLIASAVLFGLVLIFHRPLLLGLSRQIVLHYAAREHVKADFRLEGTVFNGLVMRNLHAVTIGPGPIESIDAETVHADYNLLALLLQGRSQLLRNVEVRSAQIVLNPAKAASRPHKKIRLPAVFPERGRLVDTTLIVRGTPRDLAIEHVDLDLDPGRPGELRIDKLQLPAGQTWRKISGQTSYTNRNLVLRDLALDDQERIRLLNVDASKIAEKTLSMNLEAVIGAGTISGSMTMNETRSSLNTKVHLLGERIDAAALNKYLGLPEGFIGGQIERFNLDGTGVLNKPNSWRGTMSAQANNLCQQQITFDHCAFEVSAQPGRAILQSADMVQGKNEFHLRGAAELPADLKQFGRSPATLEITAAALDLQRLTAGMPQPLTGSAQIQGKIEIKNGKIDANFMASGGSIGFENGTIDKLNVNLRASKIIPPSNIRKSWFADLRSAVDLEVSNVRYRDYAIDSVEGSLRGTDDVLKLERLNLRRNQNDLSVQGQYRLPEDLRMAASQSAEVDLSWNATELGDYWISDSPDKVTGAD